MSKSLNKKITEKQSAPVFFQPADSEKLWKTDLFCLATQIQLDFMHHTTRLMWLLLNNLGLCVLLSLLQGLPWAVS